MENGKTSTDSDVSGGVDEDSGYNPGFLEKWFNILTCRCDVNREPFEIQPVGFFELFRFGSKWDKICIATALICGFVAGMGYSLPYYVSGKMATVLMEHGKESGDSELYSQGYPYMAVDLTLAVATIVLTYVQNYLLKKACTNITATLRIEFIKALLRQDASWLDQQKFGALNGQLTENIDTIRDGIGDKIGLVVRGIAAVFGCCVFSAVVNWQMFLIYLPAVPVTVLLMSLMGRLVNDTVKRQLPFNERASSILQEAVVNVKTVQCCNGEQQMVDKYARALEAGRGFAVTAFFWGGFFDGLTFFLLYMFYMLAFYWGGVLVFEGEISPGDVFIIPTAFFLCAYYLAIVSPHFVSILKARVACARIYAKIDRVPQGVGVQAETEKVSKQKIERGEIKFEKVEFGYGSSSQILRGLTFTAEAGSVVALVGKSGCGKSTCMSLLTRLYPCHSGRITIDGRDISSINLKSLRTSIGIVQQEPVLFTGSIRENVRLGDDSISDAAVEAACRTANAHGFISQLSEKYDTLIGQGAVKLSGGQKQRIAIARAIVHDPKVLLLDEATSALDVESECHVQEALTRAAAGRTTVVIAHRLSTLRDADKIVVVEGGRVVEEGSHSDLRAKGGIYENLVKAQEFKEAAEKRPGTVPDPDPLRSRGDSILTDKSPFVSQPSGRVPNLRLSLTVDPFVASKDAKKGTENGLFLLYSNTQQNRGKLIAATVISLMRGLELPMFVLALDFIFIHLEDTSDWSSFHSKLMAYSWMEVGLGIFSFFTIFLPTALYGWASECIVDAIKIRAFASVLKKDAKYFDQSETSNAKVIQKINSDAPQLKSALDNRMLHFVNNVFAILVLMIEGFLFSWQILLAGGAAITVMMSVIYFFGNLAQKAASRVAQLDDTANISVEIIENIRTIQLLTQEEYFVRKFTRHTRTATREVLQGASHESVVIAVAMASAYICDLVSYSTGMPLIYHGLTSPNECYVAAMNVCLTSWAIQFSSMSLIDLLHAKPAAESLIPLIDAGIDNDGRLLESHLRRPDKDIHGLVEAKNVTFAYPSRPQLNVANRLNLRVEPHTTVALVGPSGGGKSTIIQLLERLYVEQTGQILIDRQNIDTFDLRNLRSQMALVGQEPVLFSGTIFENIVLGTGIDSMDSVKTACETANAAAFIEKLPAGYETETGEKGAQLSGGQKQRIAIARAMIRQPKILLLDEATSALDAESERAIQVALDKAAESTTCITIAHRLSSIQHADKIYFIENGSVVEAGTHDELMEAEGKYSVLVNKQQLKK